MNKHDLKVGDKVKCVYSTNRMYTKGVEYEVEGFDVQGCPTLRDNDGDISPDAGQPLNGYFWKFEKA